MNQPTVYSVYSDAERQSRETFLALTRALSHPGSVQRITYPESIDLAAVFSAIGDTLLDLETSYFSPDVALVARLKVQGAAMIGIFHQPEEVQHLVDDEIHLNGSQIPEAENLADSENSYVVD